MKQGPKYIKIVLNNVERGKVKKCQICGQTFGLMLKEHQCKRCHRAVCDKCAAHKAITLIDGVVSKQPHRQCNICKEERDQLKKFIQQYKVVFMEDTYSVEWLKSFNYNKERASIEYDQAQRQDNSDKNQEEFNKMKAELQLVFQEIIHYKNYSIAEFFYLVIKDFDITLILDSLLRVLGTFLRTYPEVGYAPDQVFFTLFLLCFCSESAAYSLLVLFYSSVIPNYAYPLNVRNQKYEYLSEIEKTMQVLTQAFKMSSQDAPQMKTFLRYRLFRYIQSFTLNFFLFETTFFVINQLFLQPKSGFDDFVKYLASAYNPYLLKIRQQQYDEIELVLLRNVRSSIVQDGYFLTKQVDFSKIITPTPRKSIVSALQKSNFVENDDPQSRQQREEIQQLRQEVLKQKKIISDQEIKLDKQQKEIEKLELKLIQAQQLMLIKDNKKGQVQNLDEFMLQQDEEFQNLRRVTHQKIANNDFEKQSMQTYIQKLEQQIFIEYKSNVQLKELIDQLEQKNKSFLSSATTNDQQYDIDFLEKNLEKYKKKYQKLKTQVKLQGQIQTKSKEDNHSAQIQQLEAKILGKEKSISELELLLNKNKFDNTAKILELESTNDQLEKKCREYKKLIQDFENKEYSNTGRKFEDNYLVPSLQKRISDAQAETNSQMKQQQEKYTEQINYLNQQLQKVQQEKYSIELQLQESKNRQLTMDYLPQKNQITSSNGHSHNHNQSQSKELDETRMKLQKLDNEFQILKDKHYKHLQMMIQVETDKKPNPEWQLNLITSKEQEIIILQDKLRIKKTTIKKFKQQEKAWNKLSSSNNVNINSSNDSQMGELVSKTIVLLNLDSQISPNDINDQTIGKLIEKINHLIELQNTYSEELSNVFEDGQLVKKLTNLAEEIEDSFVFDYNTLILLVEKMNNVYSRINSSKQKILQIFKFTFGQSVEINANQNIDVIILQLQSKLQKLQVEKEELQSQIEQMKLSADKYYEVHAESKREKKVLQGVRDIIVDLPILSEAEVFTFSEQQFKTKQIDQEDAKYVLEVKKQQIISLKMILIEKQNQLELFNNSLIQLRDLVSNYFVTMMK